jgi:hypothetical protein
LLLLACPNHGVNQRSAAGVLHRAITFLREADQIRNVVVADLCPAHAREETFGGIRVDIVFAAQALRLLMVDPVQLVTGMRTFP